MKKNHTDLIFAVHVDGPLSRTDCSSGLKLVMLAIRSHYSPNGAVYPGVRRLASLVGLTEKQVKRHIKRAREMGFLKVTKGLHKTNDYFLSEEWKKGHQRLAAGDTDGTIVGDIEGTMEGTCMSPKEYPVEESPLKNDVDHPPGNPCGPSGSYKPPSACEKLKHQLQEIGVRFGLPPMPDKFADTVLEAAWVVLETITSAEIARCLATRDWPTKISRWSYFKQTATNYAHAQKLAIWNGKPELLCAKPPPSIEDSSDPFTWNLPSINEEQLPF